MMINLQDLFDQQSKADWRDTYEVSKQTKLAVSAGRSGKPAHNKGVGKTTVTPKGEFSSITKAADAFGITYTAMYWLIKTQPKDYYIIKKDNDDSN